MESSASKSIKLSSEGWAVMPMCSITAEGSHLILQGVSAAEGVLSVVVILVLLVVVVDAVVVMVVVVMYCCGDMNWLLLC